MKPCILQAALFLSLVISLQAIASTTDSKIRTWTDATGVFSVEAELVEFADGKVHLKRTDGKVIVIDLERLSSADQEFLRSGAGASGSEAAKTATVSQLTGKPKELKLDDGKAAGKKSFPRGIAAAFEAPDEGYYLVSVRIHGGRYGYPQPPKEDFHVSLCDEDFNLIADFKFPYSKFRRADPKWVKLSLKPTLVPRKFVLCLNFNPERTKGVYVSHDAEGESLVGLPKKKAGKFTRGDWLIRPSLDQLKSTD